MSKAVRILSDETTALWYERNRLISNNGRPLAKGVVMLTPFEQIKLVEFLEEIAAGEHGEAAVPQPGQQK